MAASVPVEAKHRQEAKTLGCTPKTNTGGGELCRAREGRGGATYSCLLMLGLSLRLLVAQWSIEVHLCPQEESMMRQGHTQPPWLFCSKLGQLWVHVQLLEPIQKGPCIKPFFSMSEAHCFLRDRICHIIFFLQMGCVLLLLCMSVILLLKIRHLNKSSPNLCRLALYWGRPSLYLTVPV